MWKKVKEVFAYYDKNYDSKLFTYDPTDSKKVHLCDTLDIDDGALREILDGLYRTKDRSISYDFSIIDADVLGTVYEQYLSHVLKKTEKRAKLTENKMHRKEYGIYYTPIYIVDYIVRSTLGELLKDKKVNVEKIRVLDPACGSGSFLIKAFDVLNEHYQRNDKEYSQTQLDFKTGTTFTRKVKILQGNIFGVDLDKQAVEIAQLNLLLKIADKEEKIKRIIEGECKCRVEYVGLGAGSTAYLSGSAKSRGFKKGGSDLHVMDTNIFIEVTGPNMESVGEEADLWIRPDKIEYAIAHPENDHWVVHVLKKNFYIRTVHITDGFKEDYKKGHFKNNPSNNPRHRGNLCGCPCRFKVCRRNRTIVSTNPRTQKVEREKMRNQKLDFKLREISLLSASFKSR